jgi:hypothetical protein
VLPKIRLFTTLAAGFSHIINFSVRKLLAKAQNISYLKQRFLQDAPWLVDLIKDR